LNKVVSMSLKLMGCGAHRARVDGWLAKAIAGTGLVVAAALMALAPAGRAHAANGLSIEGTGASFPSHVYERWAQQFNSLNPGLNVRYTATGSGEGVRQIQARAVQFGATDSPLSAAQLAEFKLVQIPMVVGGLVPVVNLPGLGARGLVLDGPLLAALMQGEIRQWNDPRVAALNAGLTLPAMAVQRIVREDASGSSEVFTRYLGLVSPSFAQAVPAAQKPAWPGQPWRAKGSDGLVAMLQKTPGGITCVSHDRVAKDRLSAVRLRLPDGNVVSASEDAFRAALLVSDVYRKGDDQASLLAMPRKDAWPITATSFVLLDARPQQAAQAEAVSRFVYWAFMHGDELTRGTGFAPLPSRVQARLAGRLMQVHGPDGQVPRFSAP
jgi:phosphate transport system substrate-binding protein